MSSFNQVVAAELGPALIGFTISLCLYGATLAQTTLYFRSFPCDGRPTKCLVCFLFIVDTLHVYLLTHAFWLALVDARFIGLGALLNIPWQLASSFFIFCIIISVVQCFFGLRVWRISDKNWIVALIIGISSAGQLGAGMRFSAHLASAKYIFLAFEGSGNSSGRIHLICCIVCDFVISASLVYYFNLFKFREMQRTKPILQQLVILSVNTGVILCLMTAVTLILFQVDSGTYVSLCPHIILSKLYVNSLLASLNSRRHFRALVEMPNFLLPTIPSSLSIPTFPNDTPV